MARFVGVKALLSIAIVVGLAPPARADVQSNPAFLGVEMPQGGSGACPIERVTPDSAAAAAGVMTGDLVLALDGEPTAGCDELRARIVSHQPGDTIHLEILREGDRLTLHATLLTRAEVLYREFVGRSLEPLELGVVDDRSTLQSEDLRGQTTLLVWFDLQHCAGCAGVIRTLAETIDSPRRAGPAPRALAITYGTLDQIDGFRSTLAFGMTLAVAPEPFFVRHALGENDRLYVMVLDAGGIVRFVAPIAPDSDDVEAAVDDVRAAIDQAEHARVRR